MRLLDFIFESRRQLLALCHDDAMMGPSDRTLPAPVRSVEPQGSRLIAGIPSRRGATSSQRAMGQDQTMLVVLRRGDWCSPSSRVGSAVQCT